MQQMLLEGKTFVGCVRTVSNAASAQAATKAANTISVPDLLAPLKPSDTVVLTERVVAGKGGAMFIKPAEVTVAALIPAGASRTLSFPGRVAPTSEAWRQALAQAATRTMSVDTAGNDTTVLAAMAQATAAEVAAASAASAASGPMTDEHVGGNRRLSQVVDNRWWVRDTTVWPWPSVAKIGGYSGTLMSPGTG
jgi:hypothetical protein